MNFIHLKDETNRILAAELEIKTEQKEKSQRTEEELLVARTELECLKRELNEKTKVINTERAKYEELIRTEEVTIINLYLILISFKISF